MSDDTKAPREPEAWSQIPGSTYFASSLGRIRYKNGNITLGSIGSRGYPIKRISINGCKKTVKVHRLVMLAFVGPSDRDVNHKNGIKTDNRLENLEYVTRSENCKHAYGAGLSLPLIGERNGIAVLTTFQVLEIRKSKEKLITLADKYGVSVSTISRVKRRTLWRHVG